MALTKEALQERFLSLCRSRPEGLLDEDDELVALKDESTVESVVEAVNELLQEHQIELLQNATGQIVYKEILPEEQVKFKGLSSEDILVYRIVKSTGSQGIWTKDIKTRSNIGPPKIDQILKTLDSRKIIKAVKSVVNKNRKVYMLFELEPSKELTGGAWYTDQQFDAEFTEILTEGVYKYVLQHQIVQVREVAEFVTKSGISKVELQEEDVNSILRTLVFDGKLEELKMGQSTFFRKSFTGVPEESPFTSVPCGVCPVFSQCHPDGVISPSRCVYLDKWLNF